MIPKPAILASLLAVCLLTASCSQGTEAQIAAESALLSLGDFPAGWTSSPEEKFDSSGVSEECRPGEKPEGRVARADSDQFFGPDDQVVGSAVSVYLSREAAQAALDQSLATASRCQEEISSLFVQRMSAQGIDGTASTRDLPPVELGDSSTARRWVFELRSAPPRTHVSDSVAFVTGSMGGIFVYSSTGTPDPEEEMRLMMLFAGKVEKANQTFRSAVD